MTVQDLITATLQDLGVLAAGEDPSGDEADLALARFQDWVDSLALENLSMFVNVRTTWTITGASTITIGSGGTINVARPVNAEAIQNIGYQDTSLSPVTETLLGRPLTEDQYAAIAQKALTGTYPYRFYYKPSYPLGTLIPWPLPTSSTLQGVIYAATPLSEPALLTDTITLPPGYRRFYRTNLRLEFADAFEKPISKRQENVAETAKRWVKRANVKLVDMAVPDSYMFGSGKSNIYTGIE